MKLKDKNKKTMDEVSKGYEEFIKKQKLKYNGKEEFETTLKKAVKIKPKKQRGSK
jgi:hypothetical protein